MATVKFLIDGVSIEAKLRDTPTARKILDALPIEALGSYWGGEFYFDVPVRADNESDATKVVEPGTVAFWTAGHCLCLFWGPTPASRGQECRAASEVNIVGEVINTEELHQIRGRQIKVVAGD